MQPETAIEQRLAAVEAAVAALQRQAGPAPQPNWIERFTAAFKDEPAFDEVIAHGKAIRATGRLPEDAEP